MNKVRIHRPTLTPEELAARMEKIKKAAADLIRATDQARAAERTKP